MMMTTKRVAGAVAAVKGCMTVRLVVSVTELALSHKNQKQGCVMTLTNWPFPPATGAVPWTAKQEQAYQQAQRAQLPESPL
jgi:hypothetical protein